MKNIIKKFEEYKVDLEGDDLSEEYSKEIISAYIDKQNNNVTLEKVFYDTITNDNLEDHEDVVKKSLIFYITELLNDAKKIRKVSIISANKFNL